MDVVSVQQILTVALFLALLVGAAVALRLMRGHGPLPAQGRRLRRGEELALSPAERVTILQVDGAEFLLLRQRGAAPVILPLPASAPAAKAGGIA